MTKPTNIGPTYVHTQELKHISECPVTVLSLAHFALWVQRIQNKGKEPTVFLSLT